MYSTVQWKTIMIIKLNDNNFNFIKNNWNWQHNHWMKNHNSAEIMNFNISQFLFLVLQIPIHYFPTSHEKTSPQRVKMKNPTHRWTIKTTIQLTSSQISPHKTNSTKAVSKGQPQTQALKKKEPRLRLDRPHSLPSFTNYQSCLEFTRGFAVSASWLHSTRSS